MMPISFFFDSFSDISKLNKWQSYSQMRKRVVELFDEENWWRSVRIKQLKDDIERDEYEKKAAELFNQETYQLKVKRRVVVLNMRRRLRHSRNQHINKCLNKEPDTPEVKHGEFKSEYRLLMELKSIYDKEELRKWLFKTLCFITAPGKHTDPDWRTRNESFREVITSRNDLAKLKKIIMKHRPEWWCFFNC